MKRLTVVTCFVILGLLGLGPAGAQEPYKQPPADVVAILDAPPTPIVIPSPAHDAMLLVEYEAYPPIALLARPFHRLAGLRIDPARHSAQRTRQYTGILVQALAGGEARRVALPPGARVQLPVWSNDGRRIAFARDLDDGVELWIADAASGAARRVDGMQLNDVLGSLLVWERDNRHLLVGAVDASRGAPPQAPSTPIGPNIQETAGKQSQMATFQDLLATPHDEALFEHFATRRLLRVDAQTGTTTAVGAPGILLDASPSPDGSLLLVRLLHRPFSFRVPYYYFTRSVELWSPDGTPLATVARIPVSDQVPRQGVSTGPRDVQWQMLEPATLGWVEALDGGDPRAEAEHRDRFMQLEAGAALGAAGSRGDAELAGSARESLRLEDRLRQVAWTAERGRALFTEYDRDRRWTTTWVVDLGSGKPPRKLFDLSANDAYNDPGRPLREVRPDGQEVLAQDGDWIYLAGRGASEAGDRPFVDRLSLDTLRKERLFRSAADALESFVAFGPGKERRVLLTSRESPREPPNWFLVDTRTDERTRLTSFPDPAPQLTGIEKRLIKYERADGVPLSGFLYLPPGYTPGTRLPLVVWAYPLEYSDADTAGQVRGSPNTFTRLAGDSPLFFLTQGYAVLNDATMPVIGDPETMNDTYVEQTVAAAKAALDTLDAMGVADRNRACVAGHSYGAFMTANLLAHSDLFAAGIARSGAYNRSLTPFGFQAERRSYWEATETYTRLSPFTYANRIDEPLLLIHGEEDSNSGTFPIQSERLFQAIQGSGGTARLVLLPNESHGYRARESVLHVLAEMFEWADRYVKHAPPRAGLALK